MSNAIEGRVARDSNEVIVQTLRYSFQLHAPRQLSTSAIPRCGKLFTQQHFLRRYSGDSSTLNPSLWAKNAKRLCPPCNVHSWSLPIHTIQVYLTSTNVMLHTEVALQIEGAVDEAQEQRPAPSSRCSLWWAKPPSLSWLLAHSTSRSVHWRAHWQPLKPKFALP